MTPVRPPSRRWRAAGAALCLSAVAATAPARAEVTVRGDAARLEVEAAGEATEEVVAAIGEELGIALAVPPEVEPGTVSGVYRGSLATVLRALMPQASFVVTRRTGDARGVSVRFLGAADESAASARQAESDDPQAEVGGPPADRQPRGTWGRAAPSGDPQADAAEDAEDSAPARPARQVY